MERKKHNGYAWKCSICSFQNHGSIKCKICGHIDLAMKKNSILIEEQSNTWSCEDCTYDNALCSANCEMCGASSAQSTHTLDPCYEHKQHKQHHPCLSDNESISIASSSTLSTMNTYKYRHVSNEECSDDANDISYHHSHRHSEQSEARHHNKQSVLVWKYFLCKLFIKRTLFISSYIFSFIVQEIFIGLFSFCIYCPLLLIALLLTVILSPYFSHKIYTFLCLQHWSLRTVFHLMFRILNVMNAILPLLCIGYKPISYFHRTDIIFYAMSIFIFIYIVSTFGVDFIIYDASRCIVFAFKVFLRFVERCNYKLNDDGTWTNPLEDVSCLNQVNSKPIGALQTAWSVFHIIGVIGTYTFCIFLVRDTHHN